MRSLNRGPAKIYAFPAKGRFVASSEQDETSRLSAPHVPCVASTSAWYHDEAIREAEQPRKN